MRDSLEKGYVGRLDQIVLKEVISDRQSSLNKVIFAFFLCYKLYTIKNVLLLKKYIGCTEMVIYRIIL